MAGERDNPVNPRDLIHLPNPGVPASIPVDVQKLGAPLTIDSDGRSYVSLDDGRYLCYFDSAGRVTETDGMKQIPVYKGTPLESIQWGVERRTFDYDPQGRLVEAKTMQSTNGIWRIMEQNLYAYEGETFRTVTTVKDGYMTQLS